jgi:hypothetical protein
MGAGLSARTYKPVAGDYILYGNEVLYVREVDYSILSVNLGYLVCPAIEWDAGNDSNSKWIRKFESPVTKVLSYSYAR